jgi:serpin B
MKTYIVVISIGLLGWGLLSCSDAENPATDDAGKLLVSGVLDSRVVSSNTQFSFELLNELHKQEGGKNIFISPLSVSIALTMTYNGAAGETQRAMADTLNLEGLNLEEINQSNAALRNDILSPAEKVEISVANSIWAHQEVEFNADFLERNRQFFAAEVAALNFDDPDAPDALNRWVEENTKGKIDKLIERIDPGTVMILLNAIYFKGQWQIRFDKAKSQTQPFYLANGEEKQVTMMFRTGPYRAYQDVDFEAARLPYGDGRVSMYIFVPLPDSSLNAFLERLNAENWESWLAKFAERGENSQLIMPRFKLEYDASLNDALKALGMGVAFTDDADFAGMTNRDVFISEVKHKSIIEVNEEGSEAAAVTGVIIVTSAPTPFIVDRPFFFAIRDDRTGTVLFMGVVFEPME